MEGKGTEEVSDAQGDTEVVDNAVESLEQALERLDVELVPLDEEASQPETPPPLYADPTSEDDDDEGEWITPENASLHKARTMGLAPSGNGSVRAKDKEILPVGCMTADFAMQNVLLQMDLTLVGMEGKKIQKVKTWVLRCHACFKCVHHLPVVFVAYFCSESVRMRRRNFALRVATPHYFAHLSLYHHLAPLQLPQLCKYI